MGGMRYLGRGGGSRLQRARARHGVHRHSAQRQRASGTGGVHSGDGGATARRQQQQRRRRR
eukprot:ctg_3935.g569